MRRAKGRAALDERHNRVSGLVWGLLLIALGVLLSLHQLGVVERSFSIHAAAGAFDGDPETRWSSQFDDDEWVAVDLGSSFDLARVRLVWEQAHATVYEIQVSEDGSSWQAVLREDDCEGGTEEHDIEARGRWVRMLGIERATGYGFSLWELEVFAPPEPDAEDAGPLELLSRGRTAEASSEEIFPVEFPFVFSFWFSWWPLFVIAAGLPHLLVPRSDGEEIGGMVTLAVGGFFLLDNLDWTLREAAPIVLVLAGAVVVVQGLRQAARKEQAPTDGPSAGK